MRNGKLKVRRVRSYRVARYPSRHRDAKRARSFSERVLRGAAVPAVALGLGAAGGACDGGTNLLGDDPDARDAVDSVEDVATETPTDTWEDPDSMIAGGRPEGTHYVRFLTEAEGRALIAETVLEETSVPANPCEEPVLTGRLAEDRTYARREGAATSGVYARIDLLAEELAVEETPECPGGLRPAVGFEFAVDDSGDDEDVSGDTEGLTDTEEAYLGRLRETGTAAISVLRSADHPYDVWDYGGWIEDYDRARVEEEIRAEVRTILDELRRDGLI
jgi:hypothetical protein